MDNLNINNAFYFSIVLISILFWFLEVRLNVRHSIGLRRYKSLADQLRQSEVPLASLQPDARGLVARYFVIDQDGVIRRGQGGLFQLVAPVSALLPLLPTSPYRFTPALLTSIGVLGTFLGISLSLSGLSLEGADSATLMASAFNLLGGMKTAFYTSLAGMAASVVFMVVLFFCAKSRELRQRSIQSVIEGQCMEVSAITLLMQMSPDSNAELQQRQLEMAEAVIQSNESIASVTRGMDQLLRNLNTDKLADALADAVRDSVRNEIAPALDVLPKSIDELKQIKLDNGEKLASSITSAMRTEVVEPVLGDLKLLSADVGASQQLTKQLVSRLGELTSELHGTTETLNAFQSDTLRKLTEFADSLKIILDQFKTDTDGVLKNIAQEINHALASAIEGMADQRSAFEESAKAASSAFEQQNESLGKIGQGAAELMRDASTTLSNGLGDIDSKIRSVSVVVQQELESFRKEYQQNLTGFFDQQETLLDETLGRQRDGLAGVVADYRKAFEEENELRVGQYAAIKEQYEQLQQGVSLVQQLVEAVGLNKAASFDQLQDIARSVGSQVTLLRKEYGQAAQKFSDMTEQLPKAMDDYYRRAEKSHGEFFESFDAAAAKANSRLAEAAGLLVTAMQAIEMHKQSLAEVDAL